MAVRSCNPDLVCAGDLTSMDATKLAELDMARRASSSGSRERRPASRGFQSFTPHGSTTRKIAQGLESLRQGKGLDGESVMAELIAELDGLHPER